MPEISIIVPVYKVEPYLRQCVDSILAQTFSDFELILVDDGSPDGCPAICDEYASLDRRIMVIHRPNGGQSAARNTGLDTATGKYICFVDSDDYIAPTCVQTLYDLALKNGAAISSIDLCCFMEGEKPNALNSDQIFCGNGREMVQIVYSHYLWGPCGKLYSKELFSEMRFPAGLLYEDFYLLPRLYLAANYAVHLGQQMYFYRQRPDSTMGCKIIKTDLIYVADENVAFIKDKVSESAYYQIFSIIKDELNYARRLMDKSTDFARLFAAFERKYSREIRRTNSKYSDGDSLITGTKRFLRKTLSDTTYENLKRFLKGNG